jgi:flagellar biosynthesis chaperone FliJ
VKKSHRGFERLVRVRAIWERQAKTNAGAAAREAEQKAQREREAAEMHHETLSETKSLVTPEQLELQRLRSVATHAQLTEAAAARSNAQARSDAATGAWRRTSQEHDMAEELSNRRKQEAAYEARRVAERSLDELVTTRRKWGRS